MYRFFVEKEQIGEKEITILGEDVNHIARVLRMHPGEEILISDKDSMDYRCEIKELLNDKILATILDVEGVNRELGAKIYLYQALPKSTKMELVIQKAVELGACGIGPMETARCVVKLDEKKKKSKQERWLSVSESAAKQSKRVIIPEIFPVQSFKKVLEETADFEYRLFCYEGAVNYSQTHALICQVKPGDRVAIFIGPEGGFAPSEVAMALEAGCKEVSLGHRILRTETAGLAILSALMLALEGKKEV